MKTYARLALLALVALLLPACAGATFSCTRYSDGSIECGVKTHGNGSHEQPVPITEAPK